MPIINGFYELLGKLGIPANSGNRGSGILELALVLHRSLLSQFGTELSLQRAFVVQGLELDQECGFLCDGLTICKGTMTASSESSGSGIRTGSGSSLITTLTILDGTITATSVDGLGIETGPGNTHLPIFTGNITASSASSASRGSRIGIGFGSSLITTLTILDGTITATSVDGSGIRTADL
jgi:hypothetical protein